MEIRDIIEHIEL